MRVRWPDCAALRSIEVCGLTPTANTAVGAGRRPVFDRQHSLTRGLVGSSGKVPRHVPGRVRSSRKGSATRGRLSRNKDRGVQLAEKRRGSCLRNQSLEHERIEGAKP